ncbi:MAG: homoserine kinase [Mycobacteriales bacterium]
MAAGPSFRAAPVRVRVPATSANLGPGFDAFGLALSLYDDVMVRVADSGLHVDVAGEGADEVDRGKKNLVVRSVRAAFDALGGQPRGLEVICANRIPHGRGLGSSAAAIVAGITAARALVLAQLDDDDAFQLACELEGHPDNVAACIHGGATIAWRDSDSAPVGVLRLEPHQSLRAVALVPVTKLSTSKARRLLPDLVPHAAAAANSGRAALLTEALTRRPELLFPATRDLLHQDYRAPAMPRSARVLALLREAGIPATISGAGPSVLALLVEGDDTARKQVESLLPGGWSAIDLAVDRAGAAVVPLDG